MNIFLKINSHLFNMFLQKRERLVSSSFISFPQQLQNQTTSNTNTVIKRPYSSMSSSSTYRIQQDNNFNIHIKQLYSLKPFTNKSYIHTEALQQNTTPQPQKQNLQLSGSLVNSISGGSTRVIEQTAFKEMEPVMQQIQRKTQSVKLKKYKDLRQQDSQYHIQNTQNKTFSINYDINKHLKQRLTDSVKQSTNEKIVQLNNDFYESTHEENNCNRILNQIVVKNAVAKKVIDIDIQELQLEKTTQVPQYSRCVSNSSNTFLTQLSIISDSKLDTINKNQNQSPQQPRIGLNSDWAVLQKYGKKNSQSQIDNYERNLKALRNATYSQNLINMKIAESRQMKKQYEDMMKKRIDETKSFWKNSNKAAKTLFMGEKEK